MGFSGRIGDTRLNWIFPERAELGATFQNELKSLAGEKDSNLLFEQLYALAGRLASAKIVPEAARIYQFLISPESSPHFQGLTPPQSIVQRAQNQLDALQGKGSISGHAEILVGRFVDTATDYRTIVPMMAGSAVFQLSRAAALRGLSGASPSWWSYGFGARAGSALVATAVEVPAFTLLSRGLRIASGEEVPSHLGDELFSTGITLGALKLAGWGSGLLADRLPGLKNLSRAALIQGGTLAGMMGAHRLSSNLGLHPRQEGSNLLADSLAAMLSLQVGARLGNALAGEAWTRVQLEPQIRIPKPPRPQFHLDPLPVGAHRVRPALQGAHSESIPKLWSMAVSNGGETGGGKSPLLAEALKLEHEVFTTVYWQNRWKAAEPLKDYFFKLEPAERMILVRQLVTRVQTPSEDSSMLAIELLIPLLHGLEERERLAISLSFLKFNVSGGYNQSRLSTALGKAVVLLPEPDRLTLATEVESVLAHTNFYTQCAARWALDTISRSLTPDQALVVANRTLARLQSAAASERRIAVDAVASLIPLVAAPHRLPIASQLEKALQDEDYLVRRSAVEAFKSIVPKLESQDRMGRVLAVISRIESHEEKEWEIFVKNLADMFRHLSPADARAVADHLEVNMNKGEWHFRRLAIDLLHHLLESLPEDYHRIAKLEAKLEDEHQFVRPAAVNALGRLNHKLPPALRLANAFKVEAKWVEDFHHLKYSGDSALQYIIPGLSEDARQPFVARLGERLMHENPEIRQSAVTLLALAARYSQPRNRLPIALLVEPMTIDPEPKVVEAAHKALQEILPTLTGARRMKMLETVLERRGLPNLPLSLLPALFNRLPSEALLEHARAKNNPEMERVAHFQAAGLPLLAPIWKAYLEAEDPEVFLQATAARVNQHRRGDAIPLVNQWEMALAYGGLDGPEGLRFPTFTQKIGPELPPPPFLKTPFRIRVPQRKSLHRLVDKGKLREALAPLGDVKTPPAFDWYLKDAERTGKSRQEILLHRVLFSAWNRAEAGPLRDKIEPLRSGKIPSDTLRQGLLALEEFYHDTVSETLREMGIKAEELPLLEKLRDQLTAERERVRGEIGEEIEVEFLPSASQADVFFGYVAEDCNKSKGDAVYREDFQVYRMIAQDRLVGVLYLQRIKTGWFRKSLVMAIQPRSHFEVDQEMLLRSVEAELAPLVREKRYGQLLMMNDRNQQSNRQDMLAAIARQNYPTFSLRRPISGAVFSGKEFLVLWEKGKAFRPVPEFRVLAPQLAEETGELELLEEAAEEVIPAALEPAEPTTVAETDQAAEVSLAPAPTEEATLGTPDNSPRPVRLIWDSQAQAEATARFQRLLHQMMAEANKSLSVRQKRKMQRAMDAGFLDEVRRAFEEAGVPFGGFGYPGIDRGGVPHSNLPMVVPPSPLARYGVLMPPSRQELVAPGTLILKFRSLEEILSDPHVTRTDRGWFEPTFREKMRAIHAREVVGAERPSESALARGDEVRPQELFDFYNVVFHQGYQFRGYLRLLQNRGADIQELGTQIEELSQSLNAALDHLLAKRFNEALSVLQDVDAQVMRFQEIMRRIAHTVGLEIHPVTGMIYPR